MPYATYKLLHLIGVVLLLLGLGSALVSARGQGAGRSLSMLLHGVGLLLVIAAGFGLQAKGSVGNPLWLWAKVVLWVGLAMLPTMVKRGVMSVGTGIATAAVLASCAVYLVLVRPF